MTRAHRIPTNTAIARSFAESAAAAGLPAAVVQLIPTADRVAVQTLLRQSAYIDVIVPRGGESLIRAITESSSIPVIQHYAGICHTYVDEHADLAMAARIGFNAKVHRPGVCNAMETMLVHAAVADRFLPPMLRRLRDAGVELRACERTRAIVPDCRPATDDDWRTEYLDLILSVKVVRSLEEAVEHIDRYGSMHTESIVTRDYERAERFLREVQSSTVMVG